jgi:hypothetical protein
MEKFSQLFGKTAGYGLRKKRPKYSDGTSFLSLNDVMNAVLCCQSKGDGKEADVGIKDNDSNCSHRDHQGFRFQRFGVTKDGIGLSYDTSDDMLQIVVQYCKIIVTNESLKGLEDVGVRIPPSRSCNQPRTTYFLAWSSCMICMSCV